MNDMPKFQSLGESALIVQFEDSVTKEVNDRVIQLHFRLNEQDPTGFIACWPAINSLAVCFDPLVVSAERLQGEIVDLLSDDSVRVMPPNTVEIPVSYAPEDSPDMESVQRATGLTREEVIDLHRSAKYQVFMLGFLAGFAYLGPLPEALECPRLPRPRRAVAAGSVGIAGLQTGIYPSISPGGWRIIGRTDLSMFSSDPEQPFLLRPGDIVQFV